MINLSTVGIELVDLFASPLSGISSPMNDGAGDKPSNELPKQVLAWKVNWDKVNSELVFFYELVAPYTLPTGTIEELHAFLNKIISGQDPGWRAPKSGSGNTGVSPLSIRHVERSIMVFYLDRANNWEYSKKKLPFQVEVGLEDYYTFARAAVLVGGNVKLVAKPNDGCNCALFIADAASDRADHGIGTDKYFRTSFNIYVDLLTAQPPRRLPIAIDPDVGHPGGSEP
jgi:hypothetical protein